MDATKIASIVFCAAYGQKYICLLGTHSLSNANNLSIATLYVRNQIENLGEKSINNLLNNIDKTKNLIKN